MIVDPVEITPPKQIILPFDASVKHQYALAVSGGSESYAWTSSAADIAVVDANGIVIGEAPGAISVEAQDSQNVNNYDSADVPPSLPL